MQESKRGTNVVVVKREIDRGGVVVVKGLHEEEGGLAARAAGRLAGWQGRWWPLY